MRLLNTRTDLAQWFAAQGFTIGAEIGVERGKFSAVLCAANPDLYLICVDPWQAYPGYREHVSQAQLEGFYVETRERLSPYDVTILRATSVEAAAQITDGSLDFAYLDAKHDEASVREDIAAWAPKVRPGGVLAGHDYNRSGVRNAVTAYGRPFTLTTDDRSPSWVCHA